MPLCANKMVFHIKTQVAMQPICDSSNAAEPKIKVLNGSQRDIRDFTVTLLVGSLTGNNKMSGSTRTNTQNVAGSQKGAKITPFYKEVRCKKKITMYRQSERTGFQKAHLWRDATGGRDVSGGERRAAGVVTTSITHLGL